MDAIYSVSGSLWIVAASVIIWWIYRKFLRSENIWETAGIPHVSTWAALIGPLKLFTTPFHEVQLQGYKSLGKLFGSYIFGRHVLNVGEPDLIRLVLVKDFQYFVNRIDVDVGDPRIDFSLPFLRGERWKKVRTLMSPTFSTGKIKKMTNTIVDCAETLRKNFEAVVEAGEGVDVKRLFGAFTMDTIASTAFSTKVDSHNDPDNPFVVAAREVFSESMQKKSLLFFLLLNVLKTTRFRFKPTDFFGSRFFGRIAQKLIHERKSKKQVHNDFLQLMLEACEMNKDSSANNRQPDADTLTDEVDDEDGISTTNDHLEKGTSVNGNISKGLNEDELIAQCIIFFVGGFETVASTLSFVVYNLALNEDSQETLIAEIDEVLRNNNNQLTYENVNSMKYLDGVVSETLRLYPPAVNIQRIVNADYVLGEDRKIRLPKGSIVSIPAYSMHHDPEYFPDPEKFDPNRFTQEEKAARNPYVYLPFGAGPRNCIAMRFALFEVKLCLAHILSHFRFRRNPKTDVPLKFPGGQTQLIAKEIYLTVEKRQDSVM